MLKRTAWHNTNQLVAKTKAISFASAAPSLRVISKCQRALKSRIKELSDELGPELYNYANTQGDELLRKELVSKGLAGEGVGKDMVLITNGGQEAIRLVMEVVLKKGSKVMTEKLSYIGLEQAVIDKAGEIVCFSNDLNKLNLSQIERELRRNKPALVYLIPDFSNPCGSLLKESVRKLIVRLAKELSYWIIEDQTYKELYYTHNQYPGSMFSEDNKVILIGSISKMIVPGLRIGWLVTTNSSLREKITIKKESFTLSTNNLSQKLIARLLEKDYEKIIVWVRNHYGKKMKTTLRELEKNMPKGYSWTKPEGGFYIWITGPKTFESTQVLKLALKNGIGYIPGEIFYYSHKELNTFRLSISAIDGQDIAEGISRLARTLKGETIPKETNARHRWKKIRNLFQTSSTINN